MTRDGHDDRDDAPVTPAEAARADSFGKWVEGLLAGEGAPPAMDTEDRALLETATVVVASSRAVELQPDRMRKLVDQALETAVVGRRRGASAVRAVPAFGPLPAQDAVPDVSATGEHPSMPGDETPSERSTTDVRVRRRRADRVVRTLPWVVATVAAAAAVIIFVVPRDKKDGERAERPIPADVTKLSVANTSRPADPLVGRIERSAAGAASDRIDIIFADRLDGYRDLQLRRALAQEQP